MSDDLLERRLELALDRVQQERHLLGHHEEFDQYLHAQLATSSLVLKILRRALATAEAELVRLEGTKR